MTVAERSPYLHDAFDYTCAGCGATLHIPAGDPFTTFGTVYNAEWAGSPFAGVAGIYCPSCLDEQYDEVEALGYKTMVVDGVRMFGGEEHTRYQVDFLAAGGPYKVLWLIGWKYDTRELYA